MAPRLCSLCSTSRAIIKRPKTGQQVCKPCFFEVFETEVHNTITEGEGVFRRGEKVAIGASGGKDSTVLAHVMSVLNKRYDYGLDLFLLSIDEGITGYRDDSLETVKQNQIEYGLPLKILSYDELYGWTMDKIVEQIGRKNNCTFCGVFRRQALDRGAAQLGVDHIVTGHNADDIAETVLMNIMRGDIARLSRCTAICTSSEDTIKRSKPFKYAYEKEIVMYAYFKKLTYFSTECIYSPDAYRGHARVFLKDLEAIRPSAIIDIIHSGEAFQVDDVVVQNMKELRNCLRCGYMSSNDLCKACALLEGLEHGRAAAARKTSQIGVSDVPDGHRVIPFFTRQIKNSEQAADHDEAVADEKGAQDRLRELAALYPLQAGSLYSTFTDLMLSQQWYTLRLHNLQAAGWAVLFGQKSMDHPIRMILPIPLNSDSLTPAHLKVLYSELDMMNKNDLPNPLPSPLAQVSNKDGEGANSMREGATSIGPNDEEKAQAGQLDKESFYISMVTPDSSVVYYKLSKGIKKPHDVPDE